MATTTRSRAGADAHVTDVLQGVRRLERGLRLAARNVERATGISAAQLFVLEHLARQPGLSMNELAVRTHTDRSSVSGVVQRLTAAGLCARASAADDRRRAAVRITARGRAMLQRAPTPPTDLLIGGLRAMRPRDVRTLGGLMRQLNERLGFTDAGFLFDSGTRKRLE